MPFPPGALHGWRLRLWLQRASDADRLVVATHGLTPDVAAALTASLRPSETATATRLWRQVRRQAGASYQPGVAFRAALVRLPASLGCRLLRDHAWDLLPDSAPDGTNRPHAATADIAMFHLLWDAMFHGDRARGEPSAALRTPGEAGRAAPSVAEHNAITAVQQRTFTAWPRAALHHLLTADLDVAAEMLETCVVRLPGREGAALLGAAPAAVRQALEASGGAARLLQHPATEVRLAVLLVLRDPSTASTTVPARPEVPSSPPRPATPGGHG